MNARFQLAFVGETMFPPRAPFFHKPTFSGNLPVPLGLPLMRRRPAHEGPVRRRGGGIGRRRRRRRRRARPAWPRRPVARGRPPRTAADFMRWEAHANHDIWWPLRLAPLPDGDVVAFLAGRCVGGTTTINTKVALRAHERDVAKWHAATGSRTTTARRLKRPIFSPVLRPGRAGARRPRADGLAEERAHGRARLPRAGRRARAGEGVHGRELHALRLLSPGLFYERRQVDDEHVHPRRPGPWPARAACGGDSRARADRRRTCRRRRIRRE